ncbi:MAG: hypothetical protein ACD_77C00322G0012 [uncultured bacterium]|nr:MAG: hypothetical protein ACD_77C00322G0012 [uncultured bacterium]
MIRKIVIITILALFAFGPLKAQETNEIQDTNRIVAPPVMDSAMYMKNIFSVLEENGPASNKVRIEQSSVIVAAFNSHIEQSSKKKINGYRIRIYFNNSQFARNESGTVASQFASGYPGIPVYRTYTNPYFKVTVGDFRTKSEAIKLLKAIDMQFHSAFVVREIINFPPL